LDDTRGKSQAVRPADHRQFSADLARRRPGGAFTPQQTRGATRQACAPDRRERVKLLVFCRFSSWLVISGGDSFCPDTADEHASVRWRRQRQV
jgi:hypothetical protein